MLERLAGCPDEESRRPFLFLVSSGECRLPIASCGVTVGRLKRDGCQDGRALADALWAIYQATAHSRQPRILGHSAPVLLEGHKLRFIDQTVGQTQSCVSLLPMWPLFGDLSVGRNLVRQFHFENA
jgi:hypothetical protein